MLNQKNKDLNFIEKRRQWKSKMDKPLSRRMLIMVLPALVLSVFVMMAAPYIKLMMEKYMRGGVEMSYPTEMDISETKVVEKAGPPPSPEAVLRQEYRDKLDAEGFDWRKKPEIPEPDLNFAQERELPIKPVPVDLPNTMTELQARSAGGEAPSN